MSKTILSAGEKRKLEAEDDSKAAKKRRRQEQKKLATTEITTAETIAKAERVKQAPVDVERPEEKQEQVQKALWTLSAVRGGQYADRDPIFVKDELVTALGSVVKVYNIKTSVEIASLAPPTDASIVSYDAIQTDNENLVRVLYNNGVLVDWDWITGSKEQSELAKQNVDLYRLAAVGGRIASIFTTRNMKESKILIDGIRSHTIKQRIIDLRVTQDATVIAVLCKHAVLIGKKESTDKYNWVELPCTKRASCFDIRERRGDKKQDFSLAVGQEGGAIQLYGSISSLFTTGELPTAQRLHWHRNSAAAVKFSPDGNYLISGGLETVLVMWQLATGNKSYLPNLTSPIQHIVVNADGNRYALKMGDNSIMVLSTTELKPVANFAGLQMSKLRLAVTKHPRSTQKLLLSSATNATAAARPFLQTFDTKTGRHLSRQALTRNNVTDLKDSPEQTAVLPPDVEHLAISSDGNWLATVDSWKPPHRDLMYLATDELVTDEDRLARNEVYLKFWRWNPATSEWMLNSRIDQPHAYLANCAKVFKLVSDTTRPGFVTMGEDSVVRIWRPQRKVRHGLVPGDQEEIDWATTISVELQKTEDRTDLELEGSTPIDAALSMSEDGSLLAVCVINEGQQVIHMIDAETGEVKSSHDNIAAQDLVDLAFVDRFLVALSRRTLRVWDVVEDTLHYTTRVPESQSSLLAVSRVDNAIAVATSTPTAYAITIFRLQPAEQQCRVATTQPVAAILSNAGDRGFQIIFQDATIASLSPRSALSTVQLAALAEETTVTDTTAGPPPELIDSKTAIISTSAALQVEDNRSVVRPEQLAKIFDVGSTATALPTVREMFHAVAGLYGRKPMLV